MRKFLEFLRSPHGWGLALIYLVSAAVLAGGTVLLALSPSGEGWETFSYVVYGCMAICFGYCLYTLILFAVRGYFRLSERSAAVGKFRSDYAFRTLLLAVGGAAISIFMAAYYWVLFGLTVAVWYGALGGYYLVLAGTRTGLLLSRKMGRRGGKNEETLALTDARGYLASGALLVLLAFAFVGVLVLTVVQGDHLEYAGITIFVSAAYAFTKIILAVVNFVKAARRDDYTVRAVRSINIADALVSIVALQAAMLEIFLASGSAELDPATMNAAVGGIAGIAIIALGSFMIVQGVRRIRHLRSSSSPAEEEE